MTEVNLERFNKSNLGLTALSIILLLLFTSVSFSQVVSEVEMNNLLNSQIIQPNESQLGNYQVIRQISSENSIISIQENQGSLQNIILVNQNGTGNKGYVKQTGSNLETHLWQYDASNEANLWSQGNNILTSVKQDGNNNQINSYIKNLDLQSRSALLLQEGDGNRIDLALFGDGAPAGELTQEVRITQKGNNHVVEAFMEDYFAPIEITQDAGVDGNGMSISVSNSYFSFPMK